MRTKDHFGPDIAAHYDADHGAVDPEAVAAAVDLLAELAEGGPALEFAIGTGRIALPLAERGVAVSGIELSEAMVERLRSKAGGGDIPVVIGDMAAASVEGDFALVYLVFNTITNLTTQEAQVACFRNAAAHLRPGRHFLIECAVPPIRKLPPGETRLAFDDSEHHRGVDEIDVATQQGTSHHVWTDGGETRRLDLPFRYVWPNELDLMARIAGLNLVERWGDWDRSPFSAESEKHVSVWRKN